MSYKNIVFEHLEDGIATVTVNRPEKLNALNRETMGELETAFEYVQNEPTIRGLIVTGARRKSVRRRGRYPRIAGDASGGGIATFGRLGRTYFGGWN